MRYVLSGLVGFVLTLILSIPLQQFIHLREVQAMSMKAKYSGLGWGRSKGEISVDVPPLHEVNDDAREPRIKFIPQYPSEAVAKQLEGFVTMTFVVAKDGSVKNLRVVESQPAGAFDNAARRAVSRWVFASSNGETLETPQRLKLVFNLKRNLASE